MGVKVERGKWRGKALEEIMRDWRERGFSADIWVDAPGARWEGYVHDVDELVCPIDGDMEFEIEGVVYTLSPGDECLIPAGAVHSARNKGNKTVRWIYGYRRK